MDPNPPRIFISYSRRDARPQAERLQSLLRAHTLSSWRDLTHMTAGDILPQALRAIEESEHLCLILSPAALASDWVKRESTHARLHAKSVCLILADPTLTRADLPPWARRQQIFALDNEEETNLLIETLRRPSQARRVPYMEGHLPEDFVPRPHEYAQLKSAILAASQTTIGLTTALRGAGGYGKTSLANYLCRDPDIRAEFTDGILRIDIGRERNDVTGSILELCELLAPNTKHPGFQSPDSAADYLASLIGEARILLVIDDVWREAQLRPFLRPGPHVVRLVTTRIRETLPRDCTQIQIDEMRTTESFQVLAARLPGAHDPATRGKLTTLADRLGHWAQMLRIANAWLRKRTESAEPLPRAIERFDSLLTKKGLTAFDPKDKQQRDKAISACLEPSLEELGPDLPRFCDLAVLPEDENVPLDVIADLWRETAGVDPDDAEEFFSRFESLSLLQSLDLQARTLSLHDNILWYMRDRVGSDFRRITHAAMVRALFAHCAGTWAHLPVTHQYGWRNQILHLRAAGQSTDADRLLTGYAWIKTKLEASGPQSLFESYLPKATSESAQITGRAVALSIKSLALHRSELARQLYGRLEGLKEKEIIDLVAAARRDPEFYPAPRWAGLTPPGAELFRLSGHSDSVDCVSFSPNSAIILSASWDRTARLWDGATAREIVVLRGHTGIVTVAMFSHDGTHIVTSSWDATAKLWHADTGIELATLRGHSGRVRGARFDPSDALVITFSDDHTAIIWDATTFERKLVLTGHDAPVADGWFSPDGALVATTSWDSSAKVWNVADGSEIITFHGHHNVVCSAQFCNLGKRIVTASFDKTARVWDPHTGAEIAALIGHEKSVVSASFSSNGKYIITSSNDRTARLWHAADGRQILVFRGHGNELRGAKFSPDDSRIITYSNDRTARLWDAASGREIAVFRGHFGQVESACFSVDGKKLITGSSDSTLRLWDAHGTEVPHRPGPSHELAYVSFSPDGLTLLTAGPGKKASLWDAVTGRQVGVLQGHRASVKSASYSKSGNAIVTSSDDGCAYLWSTETNRVIGVFRHPDRVVHATFSPCGNLLLTACWQGSAHVWNLNTRCEIGALFGHASYVRDARFSPDGDRIVTASNDGTARVWDAKNFLEIAALSTPKGTVLGANYSNDGTRIITTHLSDGPDSAWLWDAKTFQFIAALRGHGSYIKDVCFDSDDQLIITGSVDHTVRIWDASNYQELTRLVLDADVNGVAIYSSSIAVSDALGRIHVFDVDRSLLAKVSPNA